ncbi:nucleoid-associated protein [Ruminococcus sp.]|uniref:nucleoid-associated protein n=1 Tax=Ruminococcus sp. TaxID=41978 RepID=UPI00386D3E42
MIIKKAILHILDFNSGMSVFSQNLLDLADDNVSTFLQKHIEKLHKDSARKNGRFNEESGFAGALTEYKNGGFDFIDFSTQIANVLYENISVSDRLDSIDLVAVDYILDDENYFALLLITNKSAYTHQVITDENGVHNEIMKHYAILPAPTQKIDSYALINTETGEIYFSDKKRQIDGRDVVVLPEILLECTSGVSTKEVVKIVKETANEVAEEYGVNSAVAVSKAKSYIAENCEESDTISTEQLAENIFSESPIMQEAFEKKIEEKEIPKDIKVEKTSAVRASKSQKIKTDTGIEITVPVEYFEDDRYIEFINNNDGTISIALKNIGKLINR